LKPPRKHEAIQIGTSVVNSSDLERLRTAWSHNQLVLFLGAGVSLAYGIPSWKNLVVEMLFNETEHAARMRTLFSITGEPFPHGWRTILNTVQSSSRE
jgi:hypothetical protein